MTTTVRIDLLHVGDGDTRLAPGEADVDDDQFTWRRPFRTGDIVEEVSRAALELEVDLIAMSTRGHHGFLDVLRGSTTEQVLRRAPCPVLAAPVAAQANRVSLMAFDTGEILPSTT